MFLPLIYEMKQNKCSKNQILRSPYVFVFVCQSYAYIVVAIPQMTKASLLAQAE